MIIKNMLLGYYQTQCLYIVAKLRVADHLQDGAKSATELAALTNVTEDKLYRVMRFMAAHGVFTELPEQIFQLNKASAYLISSAPDSLNHFICLHGEYFYTAAGELINSLSNDKTSFELKFGQPVTQYFAENKTAGDIYNLAMKENSVLASKLIIAAYDFSKCKNIIDIGGGIGSLLVSILLHNPNTTGINFDLPQLQTIAEKYFKQQGVQSRCQYISGDFFKSIPAGGDLYIMKAVIHGKDDKMVMKLLKKCCAVMLHNARLLIIERVMSKEEDNYSDTCINDINMLNVTSGYVRTLTEFDNIFQAAGYTRNNIYPLSNGLTIIELTCA